jgi:hypothetical protein
VNPFELNLHSFHGWRVFKTATGTKPKLNLNLEYMMSKLVSITITTILALTAGAAFARDPEPKDEGDRPAYCHSLKAYLKKYDSAREMAWFENLEKLYKQRCQKEDGEGEGHGDDGRGDR